MFLLPLTEHMPTRCWARTFYATNQISGALEEKVGIVDSVFNDPGTGESRLGVIVDNSGVVEEFTLGLSAVLLVQNQSEDLAFE